MSAVIGQGIIEVAADASKLRSGISDSKTALQSLRDVAKSVGETLNQQSIAYIRSLEKQATTIERQAATYGKSKSEIAAYNAEQLGVSRTADSLVSRLAASEKALRAQADAASDAAKAASRLAEQQRFLDSLASRAKAAPSATPFDAALQQGTALGIEPEKLTPLIAQWRAVEAAAAEATAAERAAADTASLVASIQGRIQTFGKSSTDLLELKAAQLGAAESAGPLIAQLRALEAQAIETAKAEQQAADAASFLRNLQSRVSAIDKMPSELLAMKAAELGVTAQAAPLLAALKKQEDSLNKNAAGSKYAAFQMQQLGFQVHDFAVQVISGQSPITAFVQQGSQLSGTFGGAGNAFKAVMSLLTPLRVALGGAAAAAGLLAYAFIEGQKQSKAFADAVRLTGNFAGQTEGQFTQLTRTVAASTGSSAANVRDFAQALLSTGQIGPQVFASATQAAVGYSAATGKLAAEVAKDFASMAQSPSKFALEANRQLNFLSATQYKAIKAFEENGRAVDAQRVIYDALNARFPKINENLGTLEKVLLIGKNAWAAFWDSAFDVGRQKTIEQKIVETQQALEAARGPAPVETAGGAALVAPRSGRRASAVQERLSQLGAEQTQNLRRAFRESENAFADADRGAVRKAGIEALEYVENALKAAKAGSALDRALAENERHFKAAAAAGEKVSAADQKRINDDTRKRFRNTDAEQAAKADLQRDLDAISKRGAAALNTYANAERTIEELRASSLIDERDYYEAKREFVSLNEQVEEDRSQKQIARLEEERTRLRSANATEKDRIDNQRQITDAEAALAKVRENAVAARNSLNAQEVEGLKKIALAWRAAEDAAEDYLLSLKRANARDLAGAGLGNEERARLAGRSQIEDRFSDQRRALERQRRDAEATGTFGADAQRRYDEELDRIRRFQAASLSEYDLYYEKRRQQEQDWLLGAREALRNYADEARNIAAQVQDAFTNAFHGLEDELVKLVTTGKADFKSLVASIKADIARIIIRNQITGPLAKAAEGVLFPNKDASADATKAGGLDTSGATASLQSLQTTGINPTIVALQRLQQAVDAASGSVTGSRIGTPVPEPGGEPTGAGIRTTGDLARFDRRLEQQQAAAGADGTDEAEKRAITDLFKEPTAEASKFKTSLADTRTDAQKFSDTMSNGVVPLLALASGSSRAASALALLPGLISALTSQGASDLFSKVIGLFTGGGNYSYNDGVGTTNAAGISGGRAAGGPVQAGRIYEVNEQGPEILKLGGKQLLLMGKQDGWIEPHDRAMRDTAKKYHAGGIVGGARVPWLALHEVPAVLMGGPKGKREEVLHAGDPRHIDNLTPALLSAILAAKAMQTADAPPPASRQASAPAVTNLLRTVGGDTYIGGDSVTHEGDRTSSASSTFVNLMQRLGVQQPLASISIADAAPPPPAAPVIAPVSGSRAMGGTVSPNSLYRVNERGPELLEVAGQQYLMTSEQGGRVKSMGDRSGDSSGGGGGPHVVIENHGAAIEQRRETGTDGIERLRLIVQMASDHAVSRVANDIMSGAGPVATSVRARGVNLDANNPRRN